MPQPVELDELADPLVAEYQRAWERVTAELETLQTDPLKFRRRTRLTEMRRAIEAEMRQLDQKAATWVAERLPMSYASGVVSNIGPGVDPDPTWTTIQRRAVEELAYNLFGGLLEATANVERTTKQLINRVARDTALQKAIEGRTAKQAGREMRRVLDKHGVYAVKYANGAKHGLAEYSEMAIRTQTAKAYNTGALSDPEVGFYEVFDGPSCGWTSHQDPQKALGMIVTTDQALGQLISHPNCRRAFGARPDITTAEEALAAGGGQVTSAQVAAQEAQDAERVARQQRVARRRARVLAPEQKRQRKQTAKEAADYVPDQVSLDEMLAAAPRNQYDHNGEADITYSAKAKDDKLVLVRRDHRTGGGREEMKLEHIYRTISAEDYARMLAGGVVDTHGEMSHGRDERGPQMFGSVTPDGPLGFASDDEDAPSVLLRLFYDPEDGWEKDMKDGKAAYVATRKKLSLSKVDAASEPFVASKYEEDDEGDALPTTYRRWLP